MLGFHMYLYPLRSILFSHTSQLRIQEALAMTVLKATNSDIHWWRSITTPLVLGIFTATRLSVSKYLLVDKMVLMDIIHLALV